MEGFGTLNAFCILDTMTKLTATQQSEDVWVITNALQMKCHGLAHYIFPNYSLLSMMSLICRTTLKMMNCTQRTITRVIASSKQHFQIVIPGPLFMNWIALHLVLVLWFLCETHHLGDEKLTHAVQVHKGMNEKVCSNIGMRNKSNSGFTILSVSIWTQMAKYAVWNDVAV